MEQEPTEGIDVQESVKFAEEADYMISIRERIWHGDIKLPLWQRIWHENFKEQNLGRKNRRTDRKVLRHKQSNK
jgi:hypothetical protein